MIYVTHDQVEAMTLADRIAIMKSGIDSCSLIQLGPRFIIQPAPQPKYVAGFIGSPSINFPSKGHFEDGAFVNVDDMVNAFRWPGYEFAEPRTAARDLQWMGIRPEHIMSQASWSKTRRFASHGKCDQ